MCMVWLQCAHTSKARVDAPARAQMDTLLRALREAPVARCIVFCNKIETCRKVLPVDGHRQSRTCPPAPARPTRARTVTARAFPWKVLACPEESGACGVRAPELCRRVPAMLNALTLGAERGPGAGCAD